MERPHFIPVHFALPEPPTRPEFVLAPLRIESNESDLDAWSSSVDHIHATPGFAGHPWPDEPMTLARNAEDLAEHEDDFAQRRGFTYSVLSAVGGEVIGCVYIYPSPKEGVDADVRSWVRASRAELDVAVYETVVEWLQTAWPFVAFDYAPRPEPGAQPAPGAEPPAEPPATS